MTTTEEKLVEAVRLLRKIQQEIGTWGMVPHLTAQDLRGWLNDYLETHKEAADNGSG